MLAWLAAGRAGWLTRSGSRIKQNIGCFARKTRQASPFLETRLSDRAAKPTACRPPHHPLPKARSPDGSSIAHSKGWLAATCGPCYLLEELATAPGQLLLGVLGHACLLEAAAIPIPVCMSICMSHSSLESELTTFSRRQRQRMQVYSIPSGSTLSLSLSPPRPVCTRIYLRLSRLHLFRA